MSETAPSGASCDLSEAKLRALAEFAAGAGHEINNPIATIVGYVGQLLADERDPDRRHALSTIGAQAYRIRDMIGDLMLFARPPAPRPQALELVEAIREVANKFSDELHDSGRSDLSPLPPGEGPGVREAAIGSTPSTAAPVRGSEGGTGLGRAKTAKIAASGTPSAGVRLHIDAAAPVPIFADPVQLRVVISSLLRNSLDALGAEGTITISARPIEEGGRPQAFFSIADTGPGLSPVDREHLFDPFYSGRQAGRGLGFGLSKSWRIVMLHGGRIDVESPEAGGVIFTILWPATSTNASGIEHQES